MDLDTIGAIVGLTPGGLLAWFTLHLHLRRVEQRHEKTAEVVKVLAKGHAGDVSKHRELGAELEQLSEEHAR